MIACGVVINSNEAVLVLVQGASEESNHIKCETKKLTLDDDQDSKSLSNMLATITAFAHNHKVDAFIIKSRQKKGRLASSGITFKIETLFQLSGAPVFFVSAPTLAAFSKSNLGGVPTGLHSYQHDAYRAGSWYISKL